MHPTVILIPDGRFENDPDTPEVPDVKTEPIDQLVADLTDRW